MDWQSHPTDDAIEAVIQQATATAPYSRSAPLRDTRTQLFVGNLPYRVRWQDLKDLFRKAGTVLRADVSLGPDNRSRGYGTVLLATAEDAGRAVDTFNGYSWQSRILEVRLDRQLQEFDSPVPTSSYPPLITSTSKPPSLTDDPDSDSSSSRILFVGNLPFHCQWQDLKDLFRQAGTIIRADVALGIDGRSRGFGTVVFATDLDAERALKMFNGFEFSGRILNVHPTKHSYSNQLDTTSTSPVASSSSSQSRPPHITLPPGYMLDLVPPSGPTSPYDMSKYQQHQQHQHQRQTQLQQLHLQLQQQYQHRPQQQHQTQHQRHQQHNRLYHSSSLHDIENLSDALSSASILKSSAHFSDFLPPSSSSSSRPSSTSTPAITDPIPMYKPSLSSNTNSSSDRSEMFSRLSSASATSAASSASKNSLNLSRSPSLGQGQGYLYGQVLGQGQQARGQPFQTPSPHPVSSPESASVSPRPYPHGASHHRSSSSHSSPRAPQPSSSYTTTSARSSSRPSPSNPSYHHPQRPGPISLPPPLLPSQATFNIPLLSPHMHTPLGMSVSVSVSPLVEYPGASGMYGQYQQQQFGQHMTPSQGTTPTAHGLPPMTPSMPSFTFLPSTLPSGSHAGTSARVVAGSGSDGHKHTQSKSKSRARQSEIESNVGADGDENVGNIPVSNRASSSPSPPPSSARQQHHHQHHHQQQHNTHLRTQPTLGQQSYHQNLPRHSSSDAQPTKASNASTHPQPQSIPMYINLTAVPGAFSPGVVMSPGTFYGRPGEAPTFINAAVGAPLTLRGGGDASGEGPDGTAQEQRQQGQWYHQDQTHGAYFYAMSSPRRKTSSGMEPKGYFDPSYFPAGMNVGGYTSSMGESALVNEIMKDGHAESLGVEARGRKEEGRGREEETDVSGDGDDEGDSGDDDEDSDGKDAAHDTHPPSCGDKDGDRSNKGGLSGGEGDSSVSRAQSLPAPNISREHSRRRGVEIHSKSEGAIKNARSVIPGSTPIPGGEQGESEDDHH